MHELVITIQTDNDAFQDGNKRAEVIRILRECIRHLEVSDENLRLLDENGNKTGSLVWY
jgi:hypothetical protein